MTEISTLKEKINQSHRARSRGRSRGRGRGGFRNRSRSYDRRDKSRNQKSNRISAGIMRHLKTSHTGVCLLADFKKNKPAEN